MLVRLHREYTRTALDEFDVARGGNPRPDGDKCVGHAVDPARYAFKELAHDFHDSNYLSQSIEIIFPEQYAIRLLTVFEQQDDHLSVHSSAVIEDYLYGYTSRFTSVASCASLRGAEERQNSLSIVGIRVALGEDRMQPIRCHPR
jgi:hypothetical protein